MLDLIQTLYQPETYTVSRRQILAALATSSLLFLSNTGKNKNPHPEDWLPHCTASLTTCWHLLNSDNFLTIEHLLHTYLAPLLQLAQQPSRYQRTAAALAAQACLLMDLVSYHRTNFKDSLLYANQAVEFAELSGDYDLYAYALLLQGGTYNLNQQPRKMLEQHQKATLVLPHLTPALQSYVQAELAYAYAQNGKSVEATTAINKAREQFPAQFGIVPCFIAVDYGLPQLIVFEALAHLHLATHNKEQYKQARHVLEQVNQIPENGIPQRFKVELLNYQTQTAIGLGDFDMFEHYLLESIEGACVLGSRKRQEEIHTNWLLAKSFWPHEQRMRILEKQI